MLAGKLAGYCSKRFGINCWATQTAFIARGDPYDEFIVSPSPRVLEAEIDQLLSADKATRADMAVALGRLREVQAQLLTNQESLEIQVRQRTEELAASLTQFRVVNEQLRQEVTDRTQAEEALRQSEERWRTQVVRTPIGCIIHDDRQYVDAKWKAGLRGELHDIEHRIAAHSRVTWVRENERDPGHDRRGAAQDDGPVRVVCESPWPVRRSFESGIPFVTRCRTWRGNCLIRLNSSGKT